MVQPHREYLLTSERITVVRAIKELDAYARAIESCKIMSKAKKTRLQET